MEVAEKPPHLKCNFVASKNIADGSNTQATEALLPIADSR
jgi:hypothetical protein